MLNKLLKRCMPWMDKGRWYKIKFYGDDPSSLTFEYDPIFVNPRFVSADADGLTIHADLAGNLNHYQVIDAKFAGLPGYLCVGTSITVQLSDTAGLSILVPMTGTIWIFIASTNAG